MADRATGPVKPPVIDLTARSGGRPESDNAETAETAAASRRWPLPRLDLSDANWPLLAGTAIGGAILGTVLTYLLAFVLPLPQREAPDLSPDLTAQSERIDSLSTNLSALETSTSRTQQSLDATIAQLDAGLTELRQSVAEARAASPAQVAPVDLTPLETQVRTLRAQVDAIAAGASGADAGAIASSIASVEASLTGLTTRLDGVDATVSALRTDLDAARQNLTTAAPSPDTTSALRLPLILSGLESALATGKPFREELASLRSSQPDLTIPAALEAASSTGLARPDDLQQRFDTVLPAILAARDTTSGDWTVNAVDWAKSVLALRPAEEVEGDSPEAIVSRLEGAMGRRDYAAATTLIAQLPQPMRDAAAPVAGDIAVRAEADSFVAAIRTRALADTTPT